MRIMRNASSGAGSSGCAPLRIMRNTGLGIVVVIPLLRVLRNASHRRKACRVAVLRIIRLLLGPGIFLEFADAVLLLPFPLLEQAIGEQVLKSGGQFLGRDPLPKHVALNERPRHPSAGWDAVEDLLLLFSTLLRFDALGHVMAEDERDRFPVKP